MLGPANINSYLPSAGLPRKSHKGKENKHIEKYLKNKQTAIVKHLKFMFSLGLSFQSGVVFFFFFTMLPEGRQTSGLIPCLQNHERKKGVKHFG